MKKNLFILLITLAIAGSAAAQSPKMAEQSKPKPATKATNAPSAVDGKFPILSSHIKSLGTIGHYEIASAKVRGLDTPNVTALLALDTQTGQLAVLASGNSPGLGVAIVNGASSVGGSFLFGSKIRPDRTSVNNNSDSDSDADADAEGGSAVSVSDADASSAAVAVSSSSVKNHNKNTNQQSQDQGQSQSNKNKAPKPPKN